RIRAESARSPESERVRRSRRPESHKEKARKTWRCSLQDESTGLPAADAKRPNDRCEPSIGLSRDRVAVPGGSIKDMAPRRRHNRFGNYVRAVRRATGN